MKKKIVILLLIAGIIFSLAACTKKASSGLTTISLWYGLSTTEVDPPPPDWQVLDIIREKLGINLELTALPPNEKDQDEKINAAAAASDLPDLFMVRRDLFMTLARIGAIAPVDALYPLMPNRARLHYDTDSRTYTTVNGKSYGFASPGTVAKNEGVLIRKDWLDKLGLKVPVTTEDYLNVMKAFTSQDPDGNRRADTYGYGAFIEINNFEEGLGRRFDPFFGAFGVAGTWSLDKDNPGLNVRKPAYYDAMEYIKQIIDDRLIDPEWTSYGKDDFRASWKQGRFGIMREQNAAYASETNYAPFDKNFPNGEWIVINPPLGPGGYRSVGVYTQAYRIYAISTKAMQAGKGPAIARLLEWMCLDEGYFLLGWGEEGVNFVRDSLGVPMTAGLPDPSKGYTMPEIQVYTQLRNMVFFNSEIELLARYPTYNAPTSGKKMSALTVLRDMQSRPWTANIGGDALPAPNADLKRFYEQGVIEFVTGQRQLTRENWDAWLAEFDRLGGVAWEKEGIAAAEASGYLR